MMRAEILNPGEKFIGIQDGWIVIKKMNGEIRLLHMNMGIRGGWYVDVRNEVIIARSQEARENTDEIEKKEGV